MRRLFLILILVLIVSASLLNAQPTLNSESQKQLIMSNLSSGPQSFTENRGQWDSKALFKADAGGATFWFCKDEVAYQFTRDTDELIEDGMPHGPEMPEGMPDKFNQPRYKKESMVLWAQFVGANLDAEIIGEDRLSHNNNYFIGNVPSKWATDVPNYAAMTYKDIWPGIDLRYYGNGQGMKYDFIVSPGADISQIKVRYEGVDNLSITSNGDLQADTRFGLIYENIPSIYQEIGSRKTELAGRYTIIEPGVFGFDVEGYNPALTLVIDPELVYSTYLGGNNAEWGWGIAVDGSGNAYVSGYTNSTNFPTQNPYQTDPGDVSNDAFVTKLSPSGNSLVYSTYLGGNGNDAGYGITMDGSGNAYVTGYTGSTNFPTQNPYQTDWPGWDVFVTKLSPSGNSLVYSTYLGGSGEDRGIDIAVDGSGNAYVTGNTNSPEFPTQNPYQANPPYDDAFVTKLSPSGNSLVYSTYLGGNNSETGYGIAIDDFGNAYVTGYTSSTDFPTQNPFQTDPDGYNNDVFVTKLSPSGNSLVYSTYLGGSSEDRGIDIAVDGSGNAYVTGYTYSTNFPTHNPYQADQDTIDAFVTKLSPSGNSLVYSTYLGGNGSDAGYGITVDGSGNAYVTGSTLSTNFPTQNPYQIDQPDKDAFVTKLSPSGNSLVYSTYLGGNDIDGCYGIGVDGSGSTYMTGYTGSTNFPTQNPYQTDQPLSDAFVTKLGAEGPPPIGMISGMVTEIDGTTFIEGVQVGALQGGIEMARDTTALDGIYLFPEMQLGFYDIVASKTDYIPDTLLNIEVIANDTAFANFLLALAIPPCSYLPGDANGNSAFNGLDVTYSVNYFRGIGNPPPYTCECPPGNAWFVAGDVNNSCSFNGLDVTYMVNYFKGGAGPIPCDDCPPALTDIDGNVYQTVTIGTQIWMAENLKVTHYNNGDAIPNVIDSMAWAGLTTGAYCNYNNDTTQVAVYGRLYNWYAVDDSRNIAPAGWHVPSDAEWDTLVNYLGGETVAGGKMKEAGTTHWFSPNTGATNESGFSALPGGYRYFSGHYSYVGSSAAFWSSTELGSNYAWYRFLSYGYSEIGRNCYSMQDGFSVRCVRD